MIVRRSFAVLVSVACGSLGAPALADPAAEEFLRSWVSSIDNSPDYAASYTDIATDAATGETRLTGFLVSAETEEGFAVNVDTIALGGFTPTADGTLSADMLRIENAVVRVTDIFRIEIANAELRDFSAPTAAGFVWDDDRPFVSLVAALKPILGVEMSTGRIASVSLYEKIDDVETRIAYEQINIDGWSGGKIASIAAGPIVSESPQDDQLIAMSIASAQSRDIDLNALFNVIDPERYVDGRGDRVWHTAVGSSIYRDMIVATPGVTLTMDEATVRDFKLRQPEGGIAILAELSPDADDLGDDPEDVARFLEVLTAYGVGSITLNDMQVTAPGINRLSLANLSLTDLSSDRLGEFAFDRLMVGVEEFGDVSVRRFAFGDFVPPAIEAIIAAMNAEDADQPVDVASVIPQLGFFELGGVDVAVMGQPPGSLERLRIDQRNYVGPVPTDISWELVDLDIDAALIQEADAREMLAKLGYDRVVLSLALDTDWTADGTIAVNSFNLAMNDVGTVSGDVTLSGIKPTEYMALSDPSALEKLFFVRGSVTAKDDSIVGRGLAMQAADLGIDPEAFREQFAMGLPFMLAFLGDPQLQAELAPVLQQFIKTPGGSITVVANPPAPLPFTQLMAASDAPFELLKALNVTFSGLAGLVQPAGTTSPEAPAAQEPTPESPDDSGNADGDSDTQFDTAPEAPDDTGDGAGTQFDDSGKASEEQKKAE